MTCFDFDTVGKTIVQELTTERCVVSVRDVNPRTQRGTRFEAPNVKVSVGVRRVKAIVKNVPHFLQNEEADFKGIRVSRGSGDKATRRPNFP